MFASATPEDFGGVLIPGVSAMVDSLFRDLMAEMGRPALDAALNLYPHAIEIRERVVVLDAFGDVAEGTEVWTTFAWADAKIVQTAAGTATSPVGQPVGIRDVQFEMLFVPGLRTGMRIVLGVKTYEITAVHSPGERNVYSVVTAREAEGANRD